jgi:hypothetical protein
MILLLSADEALPLATAVAVLCHFTAFSFAVAGSA